MKILSILLAVLGGSGFGSALFCGDDFRTFHFNSLVVDTHNDVVQRILAGEDISVRTKHGHSDLPRFREGGVDVEFFSIWVPPEKTHRSYFDQANEQIDSLESLIRRNATEMAFARTVDEIERFVSLGKFVAMYGLEGGHPVGNDLKKLDHFYERGVRYMTLTWNNSTDWATSAKDETDGTRKLDRKGLSEFGKKIVRRMNELGMLVDISHVGERTFWDVMKTTTKPVIASHSSVWKICPHRRNLKDDQLKAIAQNGGVVFINFAPQFVDSTFVKNERLMKEKHKARIDSIKSTLKTEDAFLSEVRAAEYLQQEYLQIRPSLASLVDHFDYVVKLMGIDHVGIGSDFDGIAMTPLDMDDVTHLPNLTRELFLRGYSEKDVEKILGKNLLRVMREVEMR